MTTLKMSVSDWIKVRDNPIQRDTERHAQKAKHLLTPLPTHAIVFAAKLPNGDLIKLDGHTRALLWKRNQVKHPPHVDVNVIQVDSIEEAKSLYGTLDSREALETSSDKVTGGYRLMKFEPSSGLLKNGNITYALRLAWRGLMNVSDTVATKVDIYTIIEEFTPELAMLDSFNLKQGETKSSALAAFILTYRRHSDTILPFWRAFFGGGGIKMNGEMDAVQALTELMLHRTKSQGGSAQIDLCGRALRAAERWLRGDTLESFGQLRPMELSGYAERKPPTYKLIKNGNGKRVAA